MGLRSQVSQRQKRLGQELQRLREEAGLSGTEAGSHVGLGRPHMSHIETGRTHIPEDKLRTLLQLYGCTDSKLVDVLVAMSQSRGRGWWSHYKRFKGTRSRELAELESVSTAHRSFEWLYIPGLLQTPEYMRTLFQRSQPDAPPEAIDEYVEFRLRRQQVLTEEPLPCYHAVVHEAAFRMQFVDRQTMRKQLKYLVEVSQFPNITIQVMPFTSDAHPSSPGAPFTIFETQTPRLRTVYVEQPVTSVFLGDQPHIEQFATDFERLSTVSLTPLDPTGPMAEGSLGLVQHVLYALKEGKHAGP
jgi:transcriptional regulator with XRE-family HTH domain